MGDTLWGARWEGGLERIQLEELTPQPHSLIGPDLKWPLKIPPKAPVVSSPERPRSRVYLGTTSAALGPAL